MFASALMFIGAVASGIPPNMQQTPPVASPPARMQRGDLPITVMIELASEPAAVTYAHTRDHAIAGKSGAPTAAADAASVEQLSRIAAEQAPLVAALRAGSIRGTLLYTIERANNAIVAELDPAELERVAALPNVKRILPMVPMTLDLTGAVPLVGAPTVWAQSGGRRGEGIRLGIIDTGVDYLHVDFAGPGVYSRTNFTTPDVPWTSAVVGGTDLAGDNYNAGSSDATKRTPKPDPDPMDCGGHGSHVAGIAAGRGVKTDGTTFTGPYGPTLNASAFRVGPGVAPAAQIYAIRVFGCSGSTLLVAQALDWALDPNRDGALSDHLDVVNMSIGSSFGPAVDAGTMVAADNAAAAGMIVVASAGNSGDTHFITGSPASATRAISVASSVDNSDVFDGFNVVAPASLSGPKPARASNSYGWTSMTAPITGDLAYPPSQRNGCSAFGASNAALIAGKVALLDWTDNECGSATRTTNAASAGAIGVLLAYNHPRLDIAIAGAASIPTMLTTQAVGDALRAGLPATIRFDAALLATIAQTDDSLTDMVSDFTSRGPRAGDALLKPDISAPGQSIFSAYNHSGNKGTSMDGTSMASPMVAGAMVLLRQIHPDWTVEEMKALAMNGAGHDLFSGLSKTGSRFSPPRIGAGRMSVADSSTLDLIAYAVDPPGSVGVSFGMVEVAGQMSLERQFRVVNKSSSTANVALTFTPVGIVPGIGFDFPDGGTLTVPAQGSAVARLRLLADASVMKHQRDTTSTAQQAGFNRHWITEANGFVTITRGQEVLRLPAAAIVRPVSAMSSGLSTIAFAGTSGHTTVPLAGRTVSTGTSFPTDWASLMSPFELQELHTRNSTIPAVQNLRYVGAASDYRAKLSSITDTTLYFGLASYGAWSSPNELDYEIGIDVTGDNVDDYLLFNTNGGDFLTPGSTDDVLIAALCPLPFPALPSSRCSSMYLDGYDGGSLDTAPYNTDVIRYPVRAASIGLSASRTRFTYRVSVYDPGTGKLVDRSARLTYDPAHSLSLYGSLVSGMYFDRPNNPVIVDWFAGDITGTGQGLLLFHFFNPTGTRAEAIPIFKQRRHSAK
jgi:hypothetical protein